METTFIFPLGQNVGLTALDVLLLLGCPVFAALGTMVSGSIKRVSEKPQFTEEKELPAHQLRKRSDSLTPEQELMIYNSELKESFREWQYRSRRFHSFRLAFIGLVLGLVIALYFVGAIKQELTSVARILALCVLMGYQAPTLWAVQETLIGNIVEEKLKQILKFERDKT